MLIDSQKQFIGSRVQSLEIDALFRQYPIHHSSSNVREYAMDVASGIHGREVIDEKRQRLTAIVRKNGTASRRRKKTNRPVKER